MGEPGSADQTPSTQTDPLASLETLRASAALLVRDRRGRVLVLSTTYKDHWELPGGGVEPAETPHQAARREALEELGIPIPPGRLLCVEHAPPRADRSSPMIHFIFDAPRAEDLDLRAVRLQATEIAGYEFVEAGQAGRLLGPRLGQRALSAMKAALEGTAIYLEDGVAL